MTFYLFVFEQNKQHKFR